MARPSGKLRLFQSELRCKVALDWPTISANLMALERL
jgi:hypothetical protein